MKKELKDLFTEQTSFKSEIENNLEPKIFNYQYVLWLEALALNLHDELEVLRNTHFFNFSCENSEKGLSLDMENICLSQCDKCKNK